MISVMFTASNTDYETPTSLFSTLDAVFDFELDPCARETIEAQKRIDTKIKYTKDQDGLKQDWKNYSTFINPPYSKIKLWVKKAIESYDARVQGYKKPKPIVLLIPARTDTKAFHQIVTHPYAKVVFLKGRLHFHNTKTSAPFPSCLVILGASSYMDKLHDVANIQVITSWVWSI